MSMLTCCPVCSTMFKVVPDQLRISQGWVRCGRCAEVFDATAHLQDRQPALPRPPAGLRGLQAQGPSHPQDKEADKPAESEAAAAALLAEALAFAGRTPSQDSAGDGYSGFTLLRSDDALPVREGDSGLGSLQPAPEDSSFDNDAGPTQMAPGILEATTVPPPEEAPSAADSTAPDDLPPTFVQQARRRSFWQRPAMRATLVLAALLLGALLLGQYAVHDRHMLAARAPALAPALQALCRQVGCTVEAPRHIDAIIVDSSTFNKLRPDAYRLSLTLKNNAPHPVAMPAVELTLTDALDQAVLRRVLLPADLGARSEVLGPSGEWTGTLGLTVAAGGNPARVSGYRVLAFYP